MSEKNKVQVKSPASKSGNKDFSSEKQERENANNKERTAHNQNFEGKWESEDAHETSAKSKEHAHRGRRSE